MVRAHVKQTPEEKKETAKKPIHPKKKMSDTGGAWPCKINDCNKAFAREADLKRHQRTTKGHSEPAYACPQCDATFTRTDALRRHQKSRHNGMVVESSVNAKAKEAESSASSSSSRASTPENGDAEKPDPKASPPKAEPSATRASYYRSHTMHPNYGSPLPPPPPIFMESPYSHAIAIPTSAARLQWPGWPGPPPWAAEGPPSSQSTPPPPPPQIYHIPPPYYPSPYYRHHGPPMMQPMGPPGYPPAYPPEYMAHYNAVVYPGGYPRPPPGSYPVPSGSASDTQSPNLPTNATRAASDPSTSEDEDDGEEEDADGDADGETDAGDQDAEHELDNGMDMGDEEGEEQAAVSDMLQAAGGSDERVALLDNSEPTETTSPTDSTKMVENQDSDEATRDALGNGLAHKDVDMTPESTPAETFYMSAETATGDVIPSSGTVPTCAKEDLDRTEPTAPQNEARLGIVEVGNGAVTRTGPFEIPQHPTETSPMLNPAELLTQESLASPQHSVTSA